MILIKGGKIKPITGAEIENGELLIGDDGKIAAIGKTVDAPADAKVIDATGCLRDPRLHRRALPYRYRRRGDALGGQ